jgi:hypothetical protein
MQALTTPDGETGGLLAPLPPAGEPVERLLRQAQYFVPGGTPSPDFREVHRKGGRAAEEFYRERWRHDKEVRSTLGANCTGSCSWKVHVKDGIITWETQQTDYPSTGPDSPEYEPRVSYAAGTKFLSLISPDYSDHTKFADDWLPAAPGRRRAGHGHWARDPHRVLPRPAGALLHGLREDLYRRALPGDAARARWRLRP